MGAELKQYSFTSGTYTGETTGSQTVALTLLCGLNGTDELVPVRVNDEGILLTGSYT